MIQLLSDNEPPPKFQRKKEVKNKGKNLPQLVFSLKIENNSNTINNSNNKKLEDRIKNNPVNNQYLEDYSALEKSFSKNSTTTSQKKIRFSEINTSNESLSQINTDYLEINKENSVKNRKNQNFYFKNTEYNFIFFQTFIKDDNKEKKYYLELREKQEKDKIYSLSSFDEEKTTDEREIKWNATDYN